jgi:Glyoxalase-like domain
MVRIKEIVIEAETPWQLARFWADALTGFEVRAYDDEEIERLASIGRTPDTDPTVAVDGPGITIFFRETTRPKNERGRIHLDLVGQARNEEVERIVALGASVKVEMDEYTVMQDPEGNEFCIQDPSK